jgi:hypothetical protein
MPIHEAGVSAADLCREHGVSDASIYKWKAKFGGMEVSEAKRLPRLALPWDGGGPIATTHDPTRNSDGKLFDRVLPVDRLISAGRMPAQESTAL